MTEQNSITYPKELRIRKQWLCYDGNKKPYSASTGCSLEWHKNLADFDTAKNYAVEYGLGLGFAFKDQVEFFGVDLDGCIDPSTGSIEPWAIAIASLLGSYCEISPSYSGLKIICRGNTTERLKAIVFGDVKHGKHQQQVEFKTDFGYFALTGILHQGLPMVESLNVVNPIQLHSRIQIYKRVLAYLENTPEAIEGQGGDKHTFTIACSLIHGFNLSVHESFWLSQYWNERCKPPWPNKNLQHKLSEADKIEDAQGKERGYLLNPINEVKVLQIVDDFLLREFPDNPIIQSMCRRQGGYVPFPMQLLPNPVCRFVVEASQAIGCDSSYIALPLLSALAAAIGDSVKLQAKKGWLVSSIIWTAIVGLSGTAKSPALREVLKHSRLRQKSLLQSYALQQNEYENNVAVYDAELQNWKKQKLWNAGHVKPLPPTKPPMPRVSVSDATVESLISILADNPSGVLAEYDELSAFFGLLNKYRSGNDSDGPAFLSMYNAEPITVDRKSGGHTFVPAPHVSITGGIQPDLFLLCFTKKYQASGLLARFMMAQPPQVAKQWTENEISDETSQNMALLFEYVYAIQPAIDEHGNRTPHLLKLAAEAKKIWIEFNNKHNTETVEQSGNLAAAFSKLEEIPLRLAIVFHCIKWSTGEVKDHLIDTETIDAAIKLTEWFKNETKRIYSSMYLSKQTADRETLIKWIKQKGGESSVRMLQRNMGSKYPTSNDAENALNELVQVGIGQWEQVKPTMGGRPSKRFRLIDYDSPT